MRTGLEQLGTWLSTASPTRLICADGERRYSDTDPDAVLPSLVLTVMSVGLVSDSVVAEQQTDLSTLMAIPGKNKTMTLSVAMTVRRRVLTCSRRTDAPF